MVSPFFVQAQLLDPVQFQVVYETLPDSLGSGEQVTVSVQADIDEGWYLYSIGNDPEAGPFSTSFSSVEEYFRIDGDIFESVPELKYDPNFNLNLGLHSGKANFQIPVRFSPKCSGLTPFTIEVHYQACDDVSCLPPVRKRVQAGLVLKRVRAAETEAPDFPPFDGSDAGFGVTPNPLDNSIGQKIRAQEFPTSLFRSVILLLFLLVIGLFLIRSRKSGIK
ncbi:MAG: protein-disulfide reductase DsbD N-terminal domain-containing protein [Balneolaceae bacterium]